MFHVSAFQGDEISVGRKHYFVTVAVDSILTKNSIEVMLPGERSIRWP